MPKLKIFFALVILLVFCLVFTRNISAQPKKLKPQARQVSLIQENVSLNKKIKELENTILRLRKENDLILRELKLREKERDALKKEILQAKTKGTGLSPKGTPGNLSAKIAALEKEKAVLETMFNTLAKGLRQPALATDEEENLDKVIHLNLGYTYGRKGRIKEAINEYRQALKYEPGNKEVHYNLGYLLSCDNKYKEAIEEYKNSLSGSAQDKEAYYNLAIIYSTALKDQNTAQQYYQEFVRLSSE